MTGTLTRVQALAPDIAKRSEEIERERRVPGDLLDTLRAAGAFRMVTATRHGGDEVPLPDILAVVEALSTADASVGWTVAQHAVAQLIFRHFPAATLDTLHADGPDLLGAGAVAPKGRAEREAGGWRVTGQWPFISGSPQASWFYLQCLEVAGKTPVMTADGVPGMRLALFPASEVTIVDTWQVTGLRGTASHDVRVTRRTCPQERVCRFDSPPTGDDVITRIPARDQGGLFVAAVVLGIATAALDDVVALATGGKRPAFSAARLAESPGFQERLGKAHLGLRSARAMLYAEADRTWTRAASGRPAAALDRAVLRATGAQVVATALETVDAGYALGGGTAVYDRSPLQRRLRDARTAAQHFAVGRDFFIPVGAVLAGQDPGQLLM